MCSLVGMVMKVCGVKLLWSTPGCNSHSCQPLSCSATARQRDAEGSGRLKISLPYSRAKNPAKKAWSVWRIATMRSLCCWRIMNRPLSGVERIGVRYYRFLGERIPALLQDLGDWPKTVRRALTHQSPGVHAHVDLHDHVTEAADIRFWLVRGVGRDQQPVTRLNFECLAADDWLSTVLSRDHTIFVVQVLLVGDLAADDHLARPSGKHVEIVNAGMLFGIVPQTIDLGQAQYRLVTVLAVKHEHAEIARLHTYRPTAERLRAPASGFRGRLRRSRHQLCMRSFHFVNVPMSRRRGIRCQRRILRRAVAKWQSLSLSLLRESLLHQGKIAQMANERRLRRRSARPSNNVAD